MRKITEEHFWSRVKITGPEDCWEWQGGHTGNGYGSMISNKEVLGAHRVAWELINGQIPQSMCVLHHCDNKSCVNPAHLWLGTLADNNQDRARKGRSGTPGQYGENHPRSKLTWFQVSQIRELRKTGLTMAQLALSFGVSPPAICAIIHKRFWNYAF